MSKYQSQESLKKHELVRRDPEEKAKLCEIERDLRESKELIRVPYNTREFERATNNAFNTDCNRFMKSSPCFTDFIQTENQHQKLWDAKQKFLIRSDLSKKVKNFSFKKRNERKHLFSVMNNPAYKQLTASTRSNFFSPPPSQAQHLRKNLNTSSEEDMTKLNQSTARSGARTSGRPHRLLKNPNSQVTSPTSQTRLETSPP